MRFSLHVTIIISGVILTVFVIAYFTLPAAAAYSASPVFCGSCHVMRGEYESWFQSGGHARIKCVDCHLPNGNPVEHYVWKGIDGMKDLVLFNAGMFSERIDATPHARRTAQANCLRCHGGMVSRISVEGRNCWDCHRSKFHYTNH